MQRYTVYLYLETTLHVSGGTSTHHQERIQLYLQHLVFVRPLLLPAASSIVFTKIIFNSKHFNYNIHFLNIVSVRWRPLLSTHSPKRFWKFCITRCSMVGEIAATSSLMFCFKSTVVLDFFSYTLLLRYPQRKKYCD